MMFSIYSAHIHPYKNKIVNIQELLLLINLTLMYAVSYQSNERIFSIVTNIMISLSFIQFFILTVYHFLTYTCKCNVFIALQNFKNKVIKLFGKNYFKCNSGFDVELLNIPERTYVYNEYKDGLISDDFK